MIFVSIRVILATIFNYMDIYHYDLISGMRHTYALYARFI